MTITSASEMDQIDWTRATDQYGDVLSDVATAGQAPTDVLVETIDGVTYVVGTFGNGDIMLHKYVLDPATGNYGLVKLAHYQGGSDPGDTYASAGSGYDAPVIEKVGNTIVISAESEKDLVYGWTYDLNSTPSDPDTNGLEFHAEFLDGQPARPRGTSTEQDIYEKFTLSNGETYFLRTDSYGRLYANKIHYDETTDQLTYDQDFGWDLNRYLKGDLYDGGLMVEQRWVDSGRTSFSTGFQTGERDADFWQVGDTIYGVHGGGGKTNGSVTFSKWEVDESTGEMTAAQIVYTDGTTTKDLYDLGYTKASQYPVTSPVTGAPSLGDYATANAGNANFYLQAIAGVATYDGKGPVDAIDFGDVMTTKIIHADGKDYLVVTTWSGSENGIATFEMDPDTGLPTKMTGLLEVAAEGRGDADDIEMGLVPEGWKDVTLQQVPETGEYVISIAGGDGLVQLGFDPTKSSTANGQGAISYIGVDKGSTETGSEYLVDSYAGNAAVEYTSGQTQYDLLPDGKILTTDISGYWLGDPYSVDNPPVCFVAGTKILTNKGEVPVENLRPGDLVITQNGGRKPVRWIGRRTLFITRRMKRAKFFPVRIRANSLAPGVPYEDLYLSQQHRVVIKSKIARRMFGLSEILVPANKLVHFDGIEIDENCVEVMYIHLLFDQHEVIYSNGAATESLFTGPDALKTMSKAARDEIMSLFPELATMVIAEPIARFVPPINRIKQLSMRHNKNKQPLYTQNFRD